MCNCFVRNKKYFLDTIKSYKYKNAALNSNKNKSIKKHIVDVSSIYESIDYNQDALKGYKDEVFTNVRRL